MAAAAVLALALLAAAPAAAPAPARSAARADGARVAAAAAPAGVSHAAGRPVAATNAAPAAGASAASATATDASAAGVSAAADPIGGYLADLEKAGLARPVTPSLEALRDALADAEDAMAAGDVAAAATRLYAVVESPRFDALSFAPEHQAAEYALGRALARGGATGSARKLFLRVLARGPKQPFFTAAFRAMSDIALDTRDHAGVWRALHELDLGHEGLPKDADAELSYLRGKVDYDAGNLHDAEGWFASVGRESRFYASALYFRGLIRARRGEWRLARDAFCEIVEQRDKDRLSFYIDGRYFAVKDLAFLALGRISHEEDKHDEAYYFYFQVPEDSEKLPDALFEAAWTMFQKGQFDASRAFLDQLEALFPRSPLLPEAAVLRANIDLKSCAFDRARTALKTFVARYAPVLAEVRRAQGDAQRRQALLGRLLARDRVEADAADDRILELLKVDPRFFRLHAWVRRLEADEAGAVRTAGLWAEVDRRATPPAQGPAAATPATAGSALALAKDVQALMPVAAGEPEMERRTRLLLTRVEQTANPEAGWFGVEAAEARALGGRAADLRGRLMATAGVMGEAALAELGDRLDRLLRTARLGQIDAVMGKKKKLELQIANLYEGRFPPEMFVKLQLEGLIGDDEEYWPFEGERWADEYTDYK